ncbi:MAG: squalene/phytoene synthase family protein [bacterium]|nr:squalene/phytoene synthase family protein [bacterium]
MSDLQESYAWCREVCRTSGSSFFSSFRLLNPPRRNAMYALYAFARISDDLSDPPIPKDPTTADPTASQPNRQSEAGDDTRRALLQAWQQLVRQRLPQQPQEMELDYSELAKLDSYPPQKPTPLADLPQIPTANSPSSSPQADKHSGSDSWQRLQPYDLLWPALADSLQRFQIPRQLLEDIVLGVSMDLDHQSIDSWQDLQNYCYHVASAVGLACSFIWRNSETIPIQAAIQCGMAFQLTNILRDVAEDARMHRIYIPGSLLAQHQVSTRAWLQGKPDGDWPAVIQHVGNIALEQYQLGWPTIETLTDDSSRMFSLIWRSYRSLLLQVLANKSRLWEASKISLPQKTRLSLVASHFIPALYRRLPLPGAI